MEVGLGLQSDKRPGEYTAIARRAEAAGFDVITVFHDCSTSRRSSRCTLIAQATERVRLGPAALNPRRSTRSSSQAKPPRSTSPRTAARTSG